MFSFLSMDLIWLMILYMSGIETLSANMIVLRNVAVCESELSFA